MELQYDIAELKRSGYAVVLREQFESRPAFHECYETALIRINISKLIYLSNLSETGIWQFLYLSDHSQSDWLDDALLEIENSVI